MQLILASKRAAEKHAGRLAMMAEEAARRRAGAPPEPIPEVEVRSQARATASADANVSRLRVEMTNLRASLKAPAALDRAEEAGAFKAVAKARHERNAMTKQMTEEALAVIHAKWEAEQREIQAAAEAKAAAKTAAEKAKADEDARVQVEAAARAAEEVRERERMSREKLANARKEAMAWLLQAQKLSKAFVGSRVIETRSNEEQRRDARMGQVLTKLRRTRAVGLSTKLLEWLGSRHPPMEQEPDAYAQYVAGCARLAELIAAMGEDADPEPLLVEAIEAASRELHPGARLTADLELELKKLREMPKGRRFGGGFGLTSSTGSATPTTSARKAPILMQRMNASDAPDTESSAHVSWAHLAEPAPTRSAAAGTASQPLHQVEVSS